MKLPCQISKHSKILLRTLSDGATESCSTGHHVAVAEDIFFTSKDRMEIHGKENNVEDARKFFLLSLKG